MYADHLNDYIPTCTSDAVGYADSNERRAMEIRFLGFESETIMYWYKHRLLVCSKNNTSKNISLKAQRVRWPGSLGCSELLYVIPLPLTT
jgi:hypothetical protein